MGSGNIGATNVWRALGPKFGSLAFVLDVLKGVTGPVLGHLLVPSQPWGIAFCGVAAMLGHLFSPFLHFRGGKGISTSLGVLLGLMPWVALAGFALWGLALALTRMISAASVLACLAMPVLALVLHQPTAYLTVVCIMSAFAVWKHLPNMQRIANGTEPKVGQRKSKCPKDHLPV